MNRITLFCCLLFQISFGQNLIYNGDFEEEGSNPIKELARTDMKMDLFKRGDGIGAISSVFRWHQIASMLSIEAFDYRRFLDFAVPDSSLQKNNPCDSVLEPPSKGFIVVGIVLGHKSSGDDYREYLVGSLVNCPQARQKYVISMDVYIPACNFYEKGKSLGIQFSAEVPNFAYTGIRTDSQITIIEWNPLLSNTWQTVEVEYMANGTEKYMMIGDFSEKNVSSLCLKKQLKLNKAELREVKKMGQYVLIDNISMEIYDNRQ